MCACIGIRREDKNEWERRVPLVPTHVQTLIDQHGFRVYVQSSSIRAFSDQEYQQVGAHVTEDLSGCAIVLGIKEVPLHFLKSDTTYAFFSHTIKGQEYNMPMLKRLLDLNCQLIDYEKIENDKGQRLVFFGNYAGLAGMIDSLWALGQRLAWTGIPTPFSHVRPTLQYDGLEQAQAAIREVGQQIQSQGLPPSLVPLVCGFAGYGNVSRGAQEIYDLLPLVEVAPEDLHKLKDKDTHHVYKVVFKEEHMVEPIHSDARFDLQDYYHHPEKYRSKFESYLPHLTMLINGIYWSEQYPRLVTKRYLEKVFDQETMPRLQVIGDISCDVEGAIECNLHATTPGDPIYVYDPMTEQTTSGYEGRGVVVLAVDNLPAELPKESSTHFSRTLMPLVPEIVQADYTVPFHKAEISPPLKHAIIVWQGGLTPDYRYLEEFL